MPKMSALDAQIRAQGVSGPMAGMSKTRTDGHVRRELFLSAMKDGCNVAEACLRIGVVRNTYQRWRQRYPEFKNRVDAAKKGIPETAIDYDIDFGAFRRDLLGNASPWFHLEAVNHLQSCKEGEIILMLFAPEHGKTTMIEDFCNFQLAIDSTQRITVVSEKQSHAKKVLRRVRNRMEPDGPCPEYVHRFGPFRPPETGAGKTQPWSEDHFDVFKRGSTFDERDFSMSAVGITTGIQGTRADWMFIDDVQSLKSLNQTEKYVDILRQDFFSRPGMFGRICVLGTRVGENDVYEKLMEEGLIDRLMIYPAIDHAGVPLWPERYNAEQYEGMRKRVGESAWARNYQQQPTAAFDATFQKERHIEPCLNGARSVIAVCPTAPEGGTTSVVISLDPSLGGANACGAFGLLPKRFIYLSSRVDHGLTRTDQIFDILEETIYRWTEPGHSKVTEVVIERNAFQRGLLTDQRMREIINRHNVRVVPHTTGDNKYDPDLGIPAMALTFERGEVDLPYADKPSRSEVEAYVTELLSCRPYKRGNRLVQDRVMMSWFAWIRWRNNRAANVVDINQFSREASPLYVRSG